VGTGKKARKKLDDIIANEEEDGEEDAAAGIHTRCTVYIIHSQHAIVFLILQ
jgi:hypothetical protein